LPQKERYQSLAAAAIEEVRRNPAGTLQRRIMAGLYYLFGEEWFRDPRDRKLWELVRDGSSDPEAGMPPWLRDSYRTALLGSLLGMYLLAALGWRWSFGWRRGTRLATLAVLWLPLPYLLSHAESLQGPRLPLDGVLLTYAALAVAGFIPGVRRLVRKGETT
jgi:hypothetical protein